MKLQLSALTATLALTVLSAAPAQAQSLSLKDATFKCELNQTVKIDKVSADQKSAMLQFGKRQYKMQAVQTSTGAVRLEDKASGMVWLMVADKSMLLNSKQGQRLADECRA